MAVVGSLYEKLKTWGAEARVATKVLLFSYVTFPSHLHGACCKRSHVLRVLRVPWLLALAYLSYFYRLSTDSGLP